MSEVTLDKKSYKEVIEEDIRLVEKFIPNENILKKHIIMVLNQSVEMNYPAKYWDGKLCSGCGRKMETHPKPDYHVCTNPNCDNYCKMIK